MVSSGQFDFILPGKSNPMTEKKADAVIEQLWLTYYNDSLCAKGVITETQRNKMRAKIKSRAAEKDR